MERSDFSKTRFLLNFIVVMIVFALVGLLTPTNAVAADIVDSGTCGTCPWTLDSDGTLTIGEGTLASNNAGFAFWPWYDSRSQVTSVRFEEGVSLEGSAYGMFYDCSSLVSLDPSGWDTSSVTNMKGMFDGCSSLTTLDLSGFDTSQVEDMDDMFRGCSSLTTLDLSVLDTSLVYYMNEMFWGCNSLTTLDLTGFDTSQVRYMNGMFWHCSSLTTLDLSGFDPSQVKDMYGMFWCCSSLETISVGEGWVVNRADLSYGRDLAVFYGCESLVGGCGTKYDPSRDSAVYARIDTPELPGYLTKKEPVPDFPGPVTLECYSGIKEEDIVIRSCSWDDSWVSASSNKYNHALGTTLCVLSTAAYSKDASIKDLGRLGCAEGDIDPHFPKNNRTDKDFYTPDENRVAYVFGTRYSADGTPIVFVLVRGTVKNIEWESNFNVADTTYPNLYHEGFHKAYSYLKDDLTSYLKTNGIDPSRAKFVVTGHSRGAAVANIVGHELNNGSISTSLGKSSSANTYVYTFACPKCVTGGSNEQNIFNIVNPEDTVPRLALGKWGFARYGRTLVLPAKSGRCEGYGKLASQMRERFAELTGKSYVPYHEGPQTAVGFEKAFGSAAPTVGDYMHDKLYYQVANAPGITISAGGFTLSEAFHAIACIDALGEGGRPIKDGPDIPLGEVLLALVETKPQMAARLLCAVFDETIDLSVALGWRGPGINISLTGSNVGTPFIHAHTPETYMAWMLEGDVSMYVSCYTGVRIACPVDIEVRDSSGTVVCRIVDDKVDEKVMSRVDGLAASVEDGVKTIDVPSDDAYTFDITATDDGDMDVTATELNGEGASLSQVSYASLPLSEGQSYELTVNEIGDGDEFVSDWVGLESPNGSQISPSFVVGEGEIGAVSIELTVGSGEGSVDGSASASLGDQVTVCALPKSEWSFSGWYEDGELVSSEEVWTFLVDGDRELEARFAEDETGPEWRRLAGYGRYDTMAAIVSEGWSGQTGGTVVVATGEGFKDALAAAGLAGLDGGPVVLTAGKSLSKQAEAQLKALKPSKVYVAGGTFAVYDGVLSAIQRVTGVKPERVFGQTSASTSAALAKAGGSRWDGTAIIATNKSFKDALSVAPVSYAKHWPILLADNGKSLNADVIKALKDCGIRRAYIVGGTAAVTPNVEKQLRDNGVELAERLAGKNGVETSRKIADFALDNGLTVANMAFATSQNFPDALAGAALCGKNGSVLLLCDDKAQANLSFATDHASEIETGYVFGGELAFSEDLFDSLPR